MIKSSWNSRSTWAEDNGSHETGLLKQGFLWISLHLILIKPFIKQGFQKPGEKIIGNIIGITKAGYTGVM